jgi:hypothetical protein
MRGSLNQNRDQNQNGDPYFKTGIAKNEVPISKQGPPNQNGDPQIENQIGNPYFEMGIAKNQVPILKWGSPIRKLKW